MRIFDVTWVKKNRRVEGGAAQSEGAGACSIHCEVQPVRGQHPGEDE